MLWHLRSIICTINIDSFAICANSSIIIIRNMTKSVVLVAHTEVFLYVICVGSHKAVSVALTLAHWHGKKLNVPSPVGFLRNTETYLLYF